MQLGAGWIFFAGFYCRFFYVGSRQKLDRGDIPALPSAILVLD